MNLRGSRGRAQGNLDMGLGEIEIILYIKYKKRNKNKWRKREGNFHEIKMMAHHSQYPNVIHIHISLFSLPGILLYLLAR